MPTLYIHAGMPKTGTTALQSFLYNNRNILAARANLYYPTTGANQRRGGTHQELFPARQDLWTQLREEISGFPGCDIVLSEEIIWNNNFDSLKPQYYAVMQQTFPEYDIKVILYVRRLDDLFKSIFNQLTKHAKKPVEYSYADFILNEKKRILSVPSQINFITGVVGEKNLLLRVYDKTTLKNDDIIADFFDLLGRDIPEGVSPPPMDNPSMPPEALPFISKAVLPMHFDNPLRQKIIELARTAYTFPKGSGMGDEYLAEFEKEIDAIDAYLPGYKNLFSERKLSFSFPEVDVKEPQYLFLCSLLYLILIQQQEKETVPALQQMEVNAEAPKEQAASSQQKKTSTDSRTDYKVQLEAILASRSWRYTAPLRRVKKKLKNLLGLSG